MQASGGGSREASFAHEKLQNSLAVEIQRLGHLGHGIADGPVFVPRTLPGEVVEGVVREGSIHKPRILRASTDRVSAPCRHYKACGGCSLQHAHDDFVAEWKKTIVKTALLARGIVSEVRSIHTSPASSRRRATLSGRRTKKSATVGFHQQGSDVIHDIPDCLILVPEILNAIPSLAEISIYSASRKGKLQFSVTATETGLDVSVRGGKAMSLELHQALVGAVQDVGIARLSWDGETVVTLQRPVLKLGTAFVTPPPGCFLQATRQGEAALQAAVLEAVEDTDGPVVDLFSGLGTFALPLAAARHVHAVESDRSMLAALDEGWRHSHGLHHLSTEQRDLFRNPLPSHELARFAAAVIDPPRAGAEAQTRALAASKVARIAFVSCNPVTFARDAEVLVNAGYRLDWLDVVDQFRWSPHVELVAQFSLD
ncbi:MAG: class I SAM-dependent RNA methyltransferase [Silicimonas sp.]|nr:class I SAM-dependent RNA methyltransferase [Silicimonas sp.]